MWYVYHNEKCLNFAYAMHKCFAFANVDLQDNRLSGAHRYRDIQRCEERIGMYRKMEGDNLRMDEKTQGRKAAALWMHYTGISKNNGSTDGELWV